MSDETISPLRRRMIEDMTVRGIGAKTRYDYVRHVRTFAAFIGRSPDTATAEEVRLFQLHQTERGSRERRPDPASVGRPRLEVADIVDRHGAAWRRANAGHVSLGQLQVMSAIVSCRTAALGGHVTRCEACAYIHVLPKGFHRIRHYGLLASAARKANIARARQLLAAPEPQTLRDETSRRRTAWAAALEIGATITARASMAAAGTIHRDREMPVAPPLLLLAGRVIAWSLPGRGRAHHRHGGAAGTAAELGPGRLLSLLPGGLGRLASRRRLLRVRGRHGGGPSLATAWGGRRAGGVVGGCQDPASLRAEHRADARGRRRFVPGPGAAVGRPGARSQGHHQRRRGGRDAAGRSSRFVEKPGIR
jgi:Phage integrase, N-terminal SAM-like domain/Transposase zinc-binding domain